MKSELIETLVVPGSTGADPPGIRRIAAIKVRGIDPPASPPDLGPRPEVRWVAPTDLWVDESYQRNLTQRSISLIKRGCSSFSWAKMQWPKGGLVDGRVHLINGQHTAIMAAILGVPEIPVILDAVSSLADRASAFAAINQDRVGMTALDLHRAGLAAGIPEDVALAEACSRAGARLRVISATVIARPGDTAAVRLARQVVARRGVNFGTRVLRGFVLAGVGPISAAELRAGEMTAARHRDLDSASLAQAFRVPGRAGVARARLAGSRSGRAAACVLHDIYEKALAGGGSQG